MAVPQSYRLWPIASPHVISPRRRVSNRWRLAPLVGAGMSCRVDRPGDRAEGCSVASAREHHLFPHNTIFNERHIHIGEGTMIGPQATLSAGMVPVRHAFPTRWCASATDASSAGRGIVGHFGIDIGNDV